MQQYIKMESLGLTLIESIRKTQHYFQGHTIVMLIVYHLRAVLYYLD